MIRSRALSLVAVLSALPGLRAQEPQGGAERQRVFGLVRTGAGEPWPGATVTLLARPIGDDDGVGVADRVEAETDAVGRFHARIVAGLAYTAWACGDATDDGAYRTTDVQDGIVPRQPVVLTRDDARLRRQHRVRIEVADGVDLPVVVSVRARTPSVYVETLEIAADGTVALPRLPAAPTVIEVVDADGVLCASKSVDPGAGSVGPVEVPARQPVAVLVRDVFDGGAPKQPSVALVQRNEVVRLGALAADGCGRVRVPSGRRGDLVAYGTGEAGAHLQAGAEKAKSDGTTWPALRDGFEPEHHAHVGPGVTIRGRVQLGPDRPAAGAWLATAEYAMHYVEQNHRSLHNVRRHVLLDGAGRFELAHLLEEFPPSLALVLRPEHLDGLPVGWEAGFSPVVPGVFGLDGGGRKDAVRDLGDVDLRDLVPVRMSIVEAGGVPALGAVLELLGAKGGGIVTDLPLRWHADRTGRIALLLPRERTFVAVVTTAGETAPTAWLPLRTRAGERTAAAVDVEIAVPEPLVLTGTIVDDDGAPVAGMMVTVSTRGGRPPVPDAGAIAARTFGPVEVGGAFEGGAAERVRWDLQRARRAGRTDADGAFRIALPRVGLRYTVSAGGQKQDVDVDGERAPEPVDLEIQR